MMCEHEWKTYVCRIFNSRTSKRLPLWLWRLRRIGLYLGSEIYTNIDAVISMSNNRALINIMSSEHKRSWNFTSDPKQHDNFVINVLNLYAILPFSNAINRVLYRWMSFLNLHKVFTRSLVCDACMYLHLYVPPGVVDVSEICAKCKETISFTNYVTRKKQNVHLK